jgi:HEAT repeat protein
MYSPNEALDNLYLLKKQKIKEIGEAAKSNKSLRTLKKLHRQLVRIHQDIQSLEHYLEHDAKKEI